MWRRFCALTGVKSCLLLQVVAWGSRGLRVRSPGSQISAVLDSPPLVPGNTPRGP